MDTVNYDSYREEVAGRADMLGAITPELVRFYQELEAANAGARVVDRRQQDRALGTGVRIGPDAVAI